jgi:hypothetical protein
MFRLLVAGGRDYYDYKFIDQILTEWLSKQDLDVQEIVLVHGDANGVDRIAAQWAIYNGIAPEAHPANWKLQGRAAGYLRNTEMIHSGVDEAILFEGGAGTSNMKSLLSKFGSLFTEVVNNNVQY